MGFEDEKDYIMRIIKEMVRVLFSLMFGKKYISVKEEAENILLNGIDYNNKTEVAAAALFYQHLSEKEEEFLTQNNYSGEEVIDGIKSVIQKAGYGSLTSIFDK